MPHERLQEFVVIDYTREMVILASLTNEQKETIVGVAQYFINPVNHTADVAFVVRDDYQNKGIGTELLSYLTYLARKQGLLGFNAEVLVENKRMLHLFQKMGFNLEKNINSGIYNLKMLFIKPINN